jgi:hypothetical protein
MSGFLHRIAARAVRPQASVHPFVESIYSVPRRAEATDSAGPHETFSTQVEQVAAQCDPSSGDPGRHGNEALVLPSVIKATIDNRRSLQSLLPRPEAGPTAASTRSDFGAQPSATDSAAASQQDFAGHFAGQGEGLEYVPIVTGPFARTSVPEAGGISSMQALEESIAAERSKQNAQSAQFPPVKHATALQGDDVQIHIGRIEVVAVPQAPPRPAPAPARKGLSLEEYLRQRDGRAG